MVRILPYGRVLPLVAVEALLHRTDCIVLP